MDGLPQIDTNAPARKKRGKTNAFKAAGQMVALQAERTKLEQVTIPRAYAAFGRVAIKNKSVISALSEEVSAIRQLSDEVKRLAAATQARTPSATLMDRAKEVAQNTAALAQAKATEVRLFQALVDFGKKAYARRELLGGDTKEITAIATALSRQEELKARIQQLGSGSQENWLKPQRIILVAGVIFVGLMVAAIRPKGTRDRQDASESGAPDHPARTARANSDYMRGYEELFNTGRLLASELKSNPLVAEQTISIYENPLRNTINQLLQSGVPPDDPMVQVYRGKLDGFRAGLREGR